MKYTIFELATGRIEKIVGCTVDDLLYQFDLGTHSFVEGDYPDDKNYIVDWTVYPIPEQPGIHFAFDYGSKQWIDPRTLTNLQDAQWELMKSEREKYFNAPLITPYGTFDSDPVSRGRITDAVLMLQSLASLGQPGTVDFTLADDTVVNLDTTQMITVGLLLGQKVQTAFGISRLRREAIYSATTPEGVAEVVW